VTGHADADRGAVHLRLMGEREDIEMIASLLACAGAEIVTRSGARPNRTDPGVRVHMVVRAPEDPRREAGA
jgi:hypothetical protein